MWTILRFCVLLVRQDMNKGHWKDPLPFRLSFDVANLQGEKRVVRMEAVAPRQAQWVRAQPSLPTDLAVESQAYPSSHPLVNYRELNGHKLHKERANDRTSNMLSILHGSCCTHTAIP